MSNNFGLDNTDSLVQACSNSNAFALELLQFCTKHLIHTGTNNCMVLFSSTWPSLPKYWLKTPYSLPLPLKMDKKSNNVWHIVSNSEIGHPGSHKCDHYPLVIYLIVKSRWPIFKWFAETWQHDRVPGLYPQQWSGGDIPYILWPSKQFAKNFQLWLHHSWISVVNSITHDQPIIIQSDPCILLYI